MVGKFREYHKARYTGVDAGIFRPLLNSGIFDNVILLLYEGIGTYSVRVAPPNHRHSSSFSALIRSTPLLLCPPFLPLSSPPELGGHVLYKRLQDHEYELKSSERINIRVQLGFEQLMQEMEAEVT